VIKPEQRRPSRMIEQRSFLHLKPRL